MKPTMNILHWLNDDTDDVILQRDNAFALLSWRDFNPPAEDPFTFQTAAWLFVLVVGLPLLVLS